jgi:hypothetical protein
LASKREEFIAVEHASSRRIATQRRAFNQCRQELQSLMRLRGDLGRQLAQLDRFAGEESKTRRQRLVDSIRQVDGQIDEARAKFESIQRVLRVLEENPEPDTPRRRRRSRSR